MAVSVKTPGAFDGENGCSWQQATVVEYKNVRFIAWTVGDNASGLSYLMLTALPKSGPTSDASNLTTSGSAILGETARITVQFGTIDSDEFVMLSCK